ncbi:DUF6796 family protein [Winogradskyella immobilis]|uniref:DUF998 domain-containing protein n=1 Tax=Winogradskyella immobilis TaxID=2816852 RepID=A0ABS8EIX2_9FLAO|nr:DUF6796 family protein [Winogradskyella immobilis]MCC1483159.1 hypothetical protein [Winogradskyella immobilis]MCG0015254.1 hypothetical protein [Winogradskyella immobilis]
MKLTKTLGYLGLIASILVGLGEYFLHYSVNILGHSENYEFFQFVPLKNLTTGHFLAVIGLPFYFAGYIHIYRMLKSGNETLARIVLGIGFIAFAVGGIWIGSRASIGNIVHLKDAMDTSTYQNLLAHYTDHMEILVKALRIVIATLSVVFAITIIKGGTYYKKWMAIFNPIVILILLVVLGRLIPSIGKHMLPILMNVTHFILFVLSLYQLNKLTKSQE